MSAFQDELLERRERYNTAYALARRVRPRLDAERFADNLKGLVAPIADSLPQGEGRTVVEPLYDLCLELTGSDLFRRSSAATMVWQRLLPLAGPLLLHQPQLLAAALTNAAYNLEQEDATDQDGWFEALEKARPLCADAETWLKVAQVQAWRSGLAHFRESAIALGESLPSDLRAALYPTWRRDLEDPWHRHRRHGAPPALLRKVGGFVGFGGKFRQPPWVANAGDGRFLVEDGSDSWLLCSDPFGSTLRRATAEIFDDERPDVRVEDNGTISWDGELVRFPDLGPVRSHAVSQNLIALTSQRSHHIFLILGPGA